MLFNLKGKGTEGCIIKRMGMRLRIEHSGGSCWAELNDVTKILPAQDSASAAASQTAAAATPTPLEAAAKEAAAAQEAAAAKRLAEQEKAAVNEASTRKAAAEAKAKLGKVRGVLCWSLHAAANRRLSLCSLPAATVAGGLKSQGGPGARGERGSRDCGC